MSLSSKTSGVTSRNSKWRTAAFSWRRGTIIISLDAAKYRNYTEL